MSSLLLMSCGCGGSLVGASIDPTWWMRLREYCKPDSSTCSITWVVLLYLHLALACCQTFANKVSSAILSLSRNQGTAYQMPCMNTHDGAKVESIRAIAANKRPSITLHSYHSTSLLATLVHSILDCLVHLVAKIRRQAEGLVAEVGKKCS